MRILPAIGAMAILEEGLMLSRVDGKRVLARLGARGEGEVNQEESRRTAARGKERDCGMCCACVGLAFSNDLLLMKYDERCEAQSTSPAPL